MPGAGMPPTEIVSQLLEANRIMSDVIDRLFQELMMHETVEEIDGKTLQKIQSAELITRRVTG